MSSAVQDSLVKWKIIFLKISLKIIVANANSYDGNKSEDSSQELNLLAPFDNKDAEASEANPS